MKRFFQWLLSPAVLGTLALLALSAMIWWLGPMISVGQAAPLGGVWVRVIVLLLIWSIWLGRLAWVSWQRRKTNTALLAGLGAGPSASDKEAQVLAQRFADAGQRLKATAGRSWWGGEQYLYELPWYMFVGAPGSGKTTALMNAGLQFLLADNAKGANLGSVKGVGGTRNCEWWFTQDAVLIDTAGRYATQESDRDVDASAWDNFLSLLKKTRPRQPINGVLLTVNIQDLLQQGPTERQEHAAKLRARLQELQTKLGVRAPVYVLVTKADLIGGFNESFESLGKEERDQVWGFTFDSASAATDDPLRDFGSLYQQLQKRLVEQLVDRLEGERDVLRRNAMFAFPQEFAALQAVLADFLRLVVSGGGKLEAAPLLRGVYFTSGTQEGSPIDRVMGALGRSFGIDARAASPGARGKSFFLHRLLRDVVFAERGLGAVSASAVRRRLLLRGAAFGFIGLASVAMLGGWLVSRSRNLDYASQVIERLPALKASLDALPPANTADVTPLPDVLTQLRSVAHGESFELADPPLLNGLGLYQGDKLDAAAQLAYARLLETALMPRVARRLEERLRSASKDNLESAYEALKTYLMLHLPEQFDAATLRAWITVDWDQNYARMAPEQRQALDAHLDALLALGPLRPAVAKDEALVANVRDMLVAFPLEYRVYSRIKRQYRPGEIPEFSAAAAGGPNAAQVFMRNSGEPLTKGVSGLYTKQGYEKLIKPAVQKTTLKLAQEEPWVLGIKNDAARLKDLAVGTQLTDKVRRLYFEDYIKTWDKFLADVRLVKLAGLERSIAAARILSAVDSPLAAYMRGVTAETRLVPPAGAGNALDKLAAQAKSEAANLAGAAPADSSGAGGPLERMVDDHFANIHRQVTGQPAPIDDTLKMFNELYTQLSAVDAAQKSKSPPPPGGAAEKVKAAAGQQPEPIRAMLEQLADAGANQSRGAEIQGLSAELKPISEFCMRAINGRYPFASGARADVLPEDFGQLFGGGGLMDDFFQRRLLNLVDTSAVNWTYKPLADGSKPVAAAALAEFQKAARIREVFFRSGGKQPAMKIELRVAEMDPALKELQLDVDGQVQKLVAGGQSISVAWPSQRVAAQIKLSSGAAGAATPILFEGPWALFRLFDRFGIEPSAVPEKFSIPIVVDGKKARVDVIAASVFNPFQLKEVKQFRCPAGL
ncbi:type VI secretion system membrane subunit TssM [Roseateles oligotrophus]|uniref:Type VI secretion system membrane subunit TssM n=1 Tax=Roseateles oligotrophus TaxID=1769250 RepID=A0ABT2YG58_9BURK|nr:type VI secretion system membrane subunit TssM [Roseateles oligotrophus]MCV2369037.1 type VI secretion system membrane subunit TssM [Roseateles oligotrophus]